MWKHANYGIAGAMLMLVLQSPYAFPQGSDEDKRTSTGLTAAEVLQKSDQLRNGWPSAWVRTRVTHFKNDKVEQENLFEVYSKGPEKVLVKSLDPRSRGLRVLVLGDDMWISLPDVSRPVRITPAQRLVGQASNGDVARTYFAADYTAKLLREEKVNRRRCAVLELTARRKGATYQRIEYWVSLEDFAPAQANFFLTSGKHSKSAVFEEYKDFGGHRLLSRMTIYDRILDREKTTMEYLEFQPRQIADKYFNTNKMSEF